MLGIGSASVRARWNSFGATTPRPRHWVKAGAENALAGFVPFSSLVSANDVITRGGDFLRVWRLDGVPFECADEHVIAERHEAKWSRIRFNRWAGDQVWCRQVRSDGSAREIPLWDRPGEFGRTLTHGHHGFR